MVPFFVGRARPLVEFVSRNTYFDSPDLIQVGRNPCAERGDGVLLGGALIGRRESRQRTS